MSNNSLRELGKALEKADRILLFPHEHIDGDAAGSAIALCRLLQKLGKDCQVRLNEELPDNLRFLDQGFCTVDSETVFPLDIAMSVDCSEPSRFPNQKEAFAEGREKITLDHHRIEPEGYDLSYVDPSAAASAELVYTLASEMDWPLDKAICECIFAGITTDTGNFQYSNTTRRTHEIVCALYDYGIRADEVSTNIYECVRPEKYKIRSEIIERMKFYCSGKFVISCVDQEMLRAAGAVMNDAEGSVAELRSINGVEIAALLKEEKGRTYVSLRAKNNADVLEAAQKLGGGGHKKAAGASMDLPLKEAYEKVVQAVLEELA